MRWTTALGTQSSQKEIRTEKGITEKASPRAATATASHGQPPRTVSGAKTCSHPPRASGFNDSWPPKMCSPALVRTVHSAAWNEGRGVGTQPAAVLTAE